jgi:TolA-binding protein
LSFVVGENYFRLGKWAEAVEPFKGFLATYYGQPPSAEDPNHLVQGPNVDAALVQLAVSCAHLDEREEAIKHLDMFIRAYTRRGTVATTHLPLALAEQGKLYYEIGELDKARSPLNRFVQYREQKTRPPFQQATSEVGRVHYYLGWVDATQNRHAEAAENFKLAAANSHGRIGKDGIPLLEDAVLQQGIALVNAKDFENAAKHLQDVVNRYREHSRKALLTYYAGLAYARIEKWNEAAAFFKRLIEEHPEAPFADKAVYEWAWCERSLEKDEAATAQYQFLIEKYPKSELLIKVQSELAELNLDAGAQDEVIAKLTETLAKVTDPNMKFEIEYQLASAYFKKKDYETSAVKFEALIPGGEQSKLLGSIRFQAGEARLALTETVPAREHFYSALQAPGVPKPLVESILMRLGETQNITGQYAEAQKTYERFLREFPESQWVRNARYGYGFALEKQENYPSAIGEYSKLLPAAQDDPLKMDKWMVQGRYQIGECYFNTKDYDKAMAIFISVDTNSQGYPEWQAKAVLEMSRILMVQDKRPDAMERLKEVMRRFPKTKAAAVAQKYLDELRFGS